MSGEAPGSRASPHTDESPVNQRPGGRGPRRRLPHDDRGPPGWPGSRLFIWGFGQPPPPPQPPAKVLKSTVSLDQIQLLAFFFFFFQKLAVLHRPQAFGWGELDRAKRQARCPVAPPEGTGTAGSLPARRGEGQCSPCRRTRCMLAPGRPGCHRADGKPRPGRPAGPPGTAAWWRPAQLRDHH